MITVTDVLTNRRWTLPDSIPQPLYISQYPPGRYDITNGMSLNTTLSVFVAPGKLAVIPAGKTWNIATQENDRSAHKAAVDYVIWPHSGRFN